MKIKVTPMNHLGRPVFRCHSERNNVPRHIQGSTQSQHVIGEMIDDCMVQVKADESLAERNPLKYRYLVQFTEDR